MTDTKQPMMTLASIIAKTPKDEIIALKLSGIERHKEIDCVGKLVLPTSLQIQGESISDAAARGLFEQAGWVVNPDTAALREFPHVTDDRNANVFTLESLSDDNDAAEDSAFQMPDFVQRVVMLSEPGEVTDWIDPEVYDLVCNAISIIRSRRHRAA